LTYEDHECEMDGVLDLAFHALTRLSFTARIVSLTRDVRDPRDEREGPNGATWWIPHCGNLSPSYPLADIFHPPYPPIASQSISRDVPLARARAFQFTLPLHSGVTKAALYCAHRAMHRSSNFSLEGGLDGLPLRVSNEGLPSAHVARAQETI